MEKLEIASLPRLLRGSEAICFMFYYYTREQGFKNKWADFKGLSLLNLPILKTISI